MTFSNDALQSVAKGLGLLNFMIPLTSITIYKLLNQLSM